MCPYWDEFERSADSGSNHVIVSYVRKTSDFIINYTSDKLSTIKEYFVEYLLYS